MRRATVACVAAWGLCVRAGAATLTVDLRSGADYTDIQSAIDAAAEGDTVLVKPGEYVIVLPILFRGKDITVKSEGGPEVTTIRMSEKPLDPVAGSVVIFMNGESRASVMEGLTLTGGTGTYWEPGHLGGGPDPLGGGILCVDGSSPTIANCWIRANAAWGSGGGLFCWESSPSLKNCTITGNSAKWGGGVCCLFDCSAILTGCRISANLAFYTGGGVYCWESQTLENCTITGNGAQFGGGVFCGGPYSASLIDCTIAGNWAYSDGGGGVRCEGASPTISGCIVWANLGGSVTADEGSDPVITYSCIEAVRLWPGTGNTNADPLFCGWGDQHEVWVDPSRPAPGDGSEGKPFSDPREATAFSLALSAASPCRGTGRGGRDMGAGAGSCAVPGERSRVVHLAPGTYNVDDFELVHHVSLLGSGQETVIEGTVGGLRAGSSLSRLTITKGTHGGIVVASGESPEIIECTITGNRCYSESYGGGGVFCWESSPTLRHCTISGNDAGGDGGGLYCYESSPTLASCTISMNVANDGGGVYCDRSSPTLTECVISGNVSYGGSDGGGVCCRFGSPELANCTIAGNHAWSGGGVYCYGSLTTLTSCTIFGNKSWTAGGGVCCVESSPTIANCAISGNWARENGGGVYCRGSRITLASCAIAGNKAGTQGGGVCCHFSYYSSPTVTNCTISGNWAGEGGGGVSCLEDLPPNLTNCIVWGNWPEGICGSVSHCLSEGDPIFVSDGVFDFERWTSISIGGDLIESPDFVVEAPDFHLQEGSPCIDAGTPIGAAETDFEGTARPQGNAFDIGAYESPYSAAGGRVIPGDANMDGKLDLSDAMWLLGHLYLGTPGQKRLPCEGGTARQPGPGELALTDVNGDGEIDLSDPVRILGFTFLGTKPPVLGRECVAIPGCPDQAGCQ